MTGNERLLEMVKDQDDNALKQTVNYLISRKDMEGKYLNQEKDLKEMCNFIKGKAQNHAKNGWNYITDEVVYAWAIMYFSLPDELLNIKKKTQKTQPIKDTISKQNNIISLNNAKKKIEVKKNAQLSLFGGTVNE